jgi:hypothetical protein
VDWMLTVIIGVWFLLLLCQVFLVGHATVTAVLDGSSLGFIYYAGWEVLPITVRCPSERLCRL